MADGSPSNRQPPQNEKVAQKKKEVKKAKEEQTGAEGIVQGAMSGAAMGPWGAVAGAAAGAMELKKQAAHVRELEKEVKRQEREATKGEENSKGLAIAGGLFLTGILIWIFGGPQLSKFGIYVIFFSILQVIRAKWPLTAWVLFISAVWMGILDVIFGLSPEVYAPPTVAVTILAIALSIKKGQQAVAKLLSIILFFAGGALIFLLSAYIQYTLGISSQTPGLLLLAGFVTMAILITYGFFVWGQKQWHWSLRLFIILVYTISGFLLISVPGGMGVNPNSWVYDALEGQNQAWSVAIEGMYSGLGLFQERTEQAFRSTFFAYEVGIEEQQDQPLGVFLEDARVTSRIIDETENANMVARLRAESFKSDEELEVRLSCYPQSDPDYTGEIRPAKKISVRQYESEDINCILEASKLGPGSHEVVMEAEFEFTTGSYRRLYFMEEERMRATPDPLALVPERRPITVFTPGPMRISISPGATLPIRLNTGREFGPVLVVTLENNWNGEIESIDELRLTLPPGLRIDRINAKEIVSGNGDERKGIKCDIGNVDEQTCIIQSPMIEELFPERKLRNSLFIDNTITTTITSISDVLQGQPIGIGSVIVEPKYTYRIHRQDSVSVRSFEEARDL